MRVLVGTWHQDFDAFPDYLLRRVPKQAGGGGVEATDDSMFVYRDDPVEDVLDDGAEGDPAALLQLFDFL